MKRRELLKGAAIVPTAMLIACKKDKKNDPKKNTPQATNKNVEKTASKESGTCVICKKCGHIKGSDKCCKPGSKMCKCGLYKGSPGCCRINKIAAKTDKDVCLCTYCGEVKGSDKCCKPGATICKCGLHKGSPGCCRIKKETKAKC